MPPVSSPFERNCDLILAVLKRVLAPDARVLELASGAGEHACYFARAMPGFAWQPSDISARACDAITRTLAREGLANLAVPIIIDAREPCWGVETMAPFDALVVINMIHISPWEATLGLMAGAARVLKPGGALITYGPYKRNGAHTSPSNEAFDASLKARDPNWGVRNVGDVEAAALARGLSLEDVVEMPANNLSLIFRLPA